MIPNIAILTNEITETVFSNRTYKIVFTPSEQERNVSKSRSMISRMSLTMQAEVDEDTELDRIQGYVDGKESVIQTIYLILMTERYKYIIYSWDYGVELLDLIGKPMPYVMSELPRRITEALLTDNRITEVRDFEFEVQGNKLHTTFTVITNVGNIDAGLEMVV